MGKYDRIKLKLPKYRPRYIAIQAKTGDTFQGRRGRYQIVSIGKDTIEVLYLDGNWEGKRITMSKVTHNMMQVNIPIGARVRAEQKLELWWERLPTIYMEEWYEGISGQELLDKLEMKYSEQASDINRMLGMEA